MIKQLGQGEARTEQARPVQVTEDRALGIERGDLACDGELLDGLLPVGAVKDEPVDPAPELLVQRLAEFPLPPEIERQVGVQMRKDDVGQRMHHLAIKLEGDLLGADLSLALACHVAVGADPGASVGFIRAGSAKISSARQACSPAISAMSPVFHGTASGFSV